MNSPHPNKDKDQLGPMPSGKCCRDCGLFKSLDAFPPMPQARDGHMGVCRRCRYGYDLGDPTPAVTTRSTSAMTDATFYAEQVRRLTQKRIDYLKRIGA